MKTEKKPISRILEFIDYLIEEKKVDSMADFERSCELYYGSIANQKRGTGLLNGGLLYQIYKAFPDLNIDWVITGRGSMRYSDIAFHYEAAYRNALNQISILNTIIEENKKEARKNKQSFDY